MCSLDSIHAFKIKAFCPDVGGDNGAARRRRWAAAARVSPNPQYLVKRTITLPVGTSDAEMDEFMVNKCADGNNFALCVEDNQGRDVNTGVSVKWVKTATPDDPPQGLSLSHLAGCTALAIFSRKGGFMGHYWENIGLSLDEEHMDLYKDNADAFQKAVVDTMVKGTKEHTSLRAVASQKQMDLPSLRAALIVPSTGYSETGIGTRNPYADQWKKMREEVVKLFPVLNEEGRFLPNIEYDPVQDEERKFGKNGKVTYDPLDDTARGKVLLKYDPDHGDKQKLMLWVERKELQAEEW
jgi:hypothetical protein